MNNPLTVFGDFFECNELHELRENLRELYRGWTTAILQREKKTQK